MAGHIQQGTSRRQFIKSAAVGTLGASLALTSKVNAKENSGLVSNSFDEAPFLPVPKHAPAKEGVFRVSNEQGIYYWDTGGNGPVVILVHPGRGSAYSWPYQQDAFAQAGFRTIAYSRRGHQGSPIKSAEQPSTDADDLLALINHLNIGKFHIVGLAAGGFTVTDFAVSFADRLLSITIACSLLGMWDKDLDTRSDFILSKGFADLPPEFKELGPSYRFAHPEGVKAWIAMEKQAKEPGLRNRQKDKNTITWQKLRDLNLPIFLLTGGADLYQPPALMRAAARQLPGCETLVVAEAGHALQWEQPNVFNHAVISFLNKVTV
ncbi:alpha/beta hydrolase [Pseudoalteromonas spongiae]|uniref:Alpha/beta hydrolase n=1 Tax=Pseudoalteromonas spongiae TaxID=298657 RepID=A0ABU8EVM1_9GAMM